MTTATVGDTRIACHDCDLIYDMVPLPTGAAARCPRCGALLYQDKADPLDRTLTLSLTALVFFVLSNTYPFLIFRIEGREQICTIFSGAMELYRNNDPLLAALVFCCSILIPGAKIAGLLYLLLPLKFGRRPWGLTHSYRLFSFLEPWGMLEVYMIGCVVSLIKLSSMATIVLGTAFYTFVALIITTTWAGACFDPRIVWQRERIGP